MNDSPAKPVISEKVRIKNEIKAELAVENEMAVACVKLEADRFRCRVKPDPDLYLSTETCLEELVLEKDLAMEIQLMNEFKSKAAAANVKLAELKVSLIDRQIRHQTVKAEISARQAYFDELSERVSQRQEDLKQEHQKSVVALGSGPAPEEQVLSLQQDMARDVDAHVQTLQAIVSSLTAFSSNVFEEVPVMKSSSAQTALTADEWKQLNPDANKVSAPGRRHRSV